MFKSRLISLLLAASVILLTAANGFILSGIYKWEDAKVLKKNYGTVREIIKSQTSTLEMFEIKIIELMPGKALANYTVEAGADEMFIIKDGKAELFINNKPVLLTKGSVAVMPQGEKIRIRNGSKKWLVFYNFRFKTGNKPAKKFSPFISLWDTVQYKPSANGGRRNIINKETSALKNLEIHVTTLKEGLPSHAAHTHADEEIILIRKGMAEESINGISYPAPDGSAIFLTNVDNHGIRNAGKGDCEYYAIRWITQIEAQKK
jgi:mannose-6-phosphate isomerase-like protein (cupin superfamily)